MSKLTLSALMGVLLLSTGTAMAAEGESSVNQGISQVCNSSELYNQYVCTGGGLLETLALYDSLFKPLPAFLNPTVEGEPPSSATSGSGSGTGSGTGSATYESGDDYFSGSDEGVNLESGMQ